MEKTQGEFDSHVSTGLIGIQFLMRGLTEHGKGDLAYTIATNRTYPSWGYMIDKGATTIWEAVERRYGRSGDELRATT